MQSKVVKYIIVGAIVLTFVLFFGLPQSRSNSGAVSEVDGVPISRSFFDAVRAQVSRLADYPASMDSRTRRQRIDNQTRAVVVQRTVELREAEKLGLIVTDRELADDIRANPAFGGEAAFDRELLERAAANSRVSVREYQRRYREDLLRLKLRRLIQSPVRVPDAEARDLITRAASSVSLRHAVARGQAFADKATAMPEQIEGLLRDELERAQAAYQRNLRKYKRDDQVRARHILFSDTSGDGEALALAARARVVAGEDFSKVARELSADPATREAGGMLGVFPRGRMLAAFDAAAFALETGVVSGPVRTDKGVHLILVDEKIAGFEKSFDEVKSEVAAELLRSEGAAAAARRAAAAVLERLGAGESFVAAAEAEGLVVGTTSPIQLTTRVIPELPVNGIREAAFALTPDRPHGRRVFPAGDDFYLISLLERTEPSESEVAETLDATRSQLNDRAQAEAYALWSRNRVQALDEAGRIVHYPLYGEEDE